MPCPAVYFLQCSTTVPRDSGENDDFHVPLLMYLAPPCNYKRRRWASFSSPGWTLWSEVGLSLSGFSLPRGRSGTTEHQSQPTPLLAETWELPSLSRLACTPYYKHSGCKIIQCPRTPPRWTYGPAAGTRINPCVTVLPLASTTSGMRNTQHHHWLGPNRRVRAPTVGAPGRGRCVTFSLLFPFDLQGWRADPTHSPWTPRIRSQRDT